MHAGNAEQTSMHFVVVKRLPEANPDVEQAQAAADAAKKTVGNDAAKSGKREQEIVVSPLGCPGQDDEQHPGYGAD